MWGNVMLVGNSKFCVLPFWAALGPSWYFGGGQENRGVVVLIIGVILQMGQGPLVSIPIVDVPGAWWDELSGMGTGGT